MIARHVAMVRYSRTTNILPMLTIVCLLAVPVFTLAGGPRALPPETRPADVRLGPLKDLNGYFPFVVPGSVEAWQERAASLRRQVLVSQGLWPMPTKTPLHAVVYGRIEQEDYTIDKVFFESVPGFFVTGNLYAPKDRSGKLPGILCPHGHWANGRFYDCGREAVRNQIVHGAERFEDGGRSPMQSRCVQLARMGCVVFHYDMIGYADSQQISRDIIHGFKKQRPEMNDATQWGLFSPQAESRLQSSMGLQTLNSIRSLDFLTSLPNVDPQRIAVTGASGGGTQTFLLSAIDPRITVAFPAVMVSTAMQGGCTCENACCLRVGTGNVELAALFAPKPLGLTAAHDWTLEMPTKGFPELQQIYRLLAAPKNVALTALPHFDHNYNYVSRAAMYSWMNKHLQLGLDEPIVEEEYTRLSQKELTVWNDAHPQPLGGTMLERSVMTWWDQDCGQQLNAMRPFTTSSLPLYQQTIRQGLDAIIARPLPQSSQLELEVVAQQQQAGYRQLVGLLTYHLPPRLAIAANQAGEAEGCQEQLPIVLLRPTAPSKRVCIMAFPEGKAGLFDEVGAVRASIRQLLDARISVCAADLLFQGEFLKPGQTVTTTRRVENPREAAAYTFGYNPTLFGRRVHDLLSLIALFAEGDYQAEQVALAGLGNTGPIAAVASTQAPQMVAQLAVDDAAFRFGAVDDLRSPMFLPGGAKYNDLPGILALAAPHKLWIDVTESPLPEIVAAAYGVSDRSASITPFSGTENEKLAAIAQWLLD